MSGAVQEVRRHLLKLAQTWPKDPLRPSMDFGEAIRRATEAELRHILQPSSSPSHYAQLVETMNRITRGQSVKPTMAQRVRRFFGLPVH